jgi:hypothetical protein
MGMAQTSAGSGQGAGDPVQLGLDDLCLLLGRATGEVAVLRARLARLERENAALRERVRVEASPPPE